MKLRPIISLTLIALGAIAALAQPAAPASERRVVDFEADQMRNVRLDNDSMGWVLVGHVVFHHNGAVITCDSAVRYSERRMECFDNVVVNQNTTYVYGESADYNGEQNMARIYAPIIKIVDKEATMYTYNFAYNTLDRVGEFRGTGTLAEKDNLFESERGYYHTATRTLVGVERAQLRNQEYEMVGDSISYNMNSRQAAFYTPSTIWNRATGEILTADRGTYDRATSTYHFTRNAYLLTPTRELWSEELDYNSLTQDAVLRRSIQIRDEEQGVMAFGDYGRYDGAAMEAVLTDNPSVVKFDSAGVEDTLYMRADTMFLYTAIRQDTIRVDSLTEKVQVDTLRTMRGYRDVKIWRADFQAVCDSAVSFSEDSTAHMYIDPVMWNGDNQITSEVIDIYSKNQALDHAHFHGGEPIMVGRVDHYRFNQIKGQQITAFFTDNEITRTDVDGNGQALYYMTEQDSLGHVSLTGFMTIECANISFHIREQEMERMVFKGQPVYFIYPMDRIPAEQTQRLPGFSWQAARRPTLEQVFHDRTMRRSERAAHEALPRPTFPLSESIHAHVAQMIKDGFWRDRNDVLSPETKEFLRSLQ